MVNNVAKFKGKMVENGYTMETLSSKMEMTPQTLSKKIQTLDAEFLISESVKIANFLNLTEDEYLYFFNIDLQGNK